MPDQIVESTDSKPDISKGSLKSDTRVIKRSLSDSAFITSISETGKTDTKTTYKNLRKKATEIQLRTLARISGEVSKALNVYQGFSNSGWTIESESDRGHRALEEWHEEQADIGVNPNDLINENVYDLYVLGAMCMRIVLINDEPKFIRNIPPEEVEFLHQYDPNPMNVDYGKIWYKGFYEDRMKQNFVVLESIVDPNPYFYYAPMSTNSKSPKGISIIESVVDLAISAGEKNYLMTEYLRGNIFPHEIVSLILSDYFKALSDEDIEFDIDKFNAIKQEAVEAVEKFIDEADSTQTLVSDVPMQKVVVGTLEGNNLEGLSEINESHEAAFPRALKCAATLLGSRRGGGTLNDTQTKYEIRSMYKNILNIRTSISKGWRKLSTAYLEWRGINEKGGITFTDTDIELKLAITDAIANEAKASKTLVEIGAFLPAEIRQAFVGGMLDLTQFDAEMPIEEGSDE